MIKNKDNVDLKELEKFGFKPKYDENTGEVIYYRLEHQKYRTFSIIPKKRFVDQRQYEPMKIYIGKYLGHSFEEWQFDILYDLIKADMVEKV